MKFPNLSDRFDAEDIRKDADSRSRAQNKIELGIKIY